MESHQDYKNDKFEWRMSNAGMCQRLMDYSIQRGVKPFDSKQIMRMEKGQWLHDMWQKHLADMMGEDFCDAEKELTFSLNSGRVITGHIDGYIKSLDALYELKTVADSTFIMVNNQDKPIQSHYEQASTYAAVYGAKNILFHYYNTNSGDSTFFLTPCSSDALGSAKDKFEAAEENEKSGVISIRPYSDPTESPCWYCSYKDECYKTWEGEVKSYGASKVLDKGFASSVSNCDSMRTIRLDADKSEKKLKKEISEFMVAMEIKDASVEGYTVNLKLGAKGNPLITIKEARKE